MRHHWCFDESGLEAALAFEDLIFVAVHHIRRFPVCGDLFIVPVNFDQFGAVDVVNAYVAFGAADYALTVVQTQGSGLQVCHFPVAVGE